MPRTSQQLVDAIVEEAEAVATKEGHKDIVSRTAFVCSWLNYELSRAFDEAPKYATRRSKELKPLPSSK